MPPTPGRWAAFGGPRFQEDTSIRVENVRPFGSSKVPDLAGFFPFIDRYGQYAHGDWPGKVHSDADLGASLSEEDRDPQAHPGPRDVDRPAIIGEFHMGALDRGLFHTGLRSVIGQDQRAAGYRYYVEGALRNPAIVGAHWFQLYDESATGRRDGENYQIGFLDICDSPYRETVAAARDIGYRKYLVRSGAK
jgi:hypothetical protein